MQAKAVKAIEARPPFFAGFSANSWAFAVRVWLACLLALYTSFWLQLEVPSSAAITVAILALPTRGQGLEKAGFRLFATAIGVAASIGIAGFFSQTDVLLLAVLGVWVGLCVCAAAMLDGNRAYAAALSCITVALITIQQIDSPQQVFPTGVARGAALVVGVLAVAFVNDVLAAPDYHPVVTNRLEALQRQIMNYAETVLRGETLSAYLAAGILKDVAALRSEIASLRTESSSGAARSSAARSAMVGLVTALSLARALALLSTAAMQASVSIDRDERRSNLLATCRCWLESELVRRDAEVESSLDALRNGTHPAVSHRAPLYRSGRIAVESGFRASICFTLIAALFVIAGWPTTEAALSLVAVIIGLGATAPDPRKFTAIAILATPISCLLAGILKYFVFNGVSEFALLAIGLAPVVIGLALLISLPNPLLSSLGRLSLVFTLAILAPTNPQSYDPLVFVITCTLACLAALLTFAAQVLIPPLSGKRRLQLLLTESRGKRSGLRDRPGRRLSPEEAAFREATRVQQIVAASSSLAQGQCAVDEAMNDFDRSIALERCDAELDRLKDGPLAEAADIGRAALARRDAGLLLAAAGQLRRAATQRDLSAEAACAALVLASVTLGPSTSAAGSIGARKS
ncbi:FUSC family protein [Bradyrhizobium symbiodeficiens]|uniref:FUSC family protein n=1 Tax=Bradyrhizobium symbiodeficiens TaxID=1404367 RepID=UPI0030D2C5DE